MATELNTEQVEAAFVITRDQRIDISLYIAYIGFSTQPGEYVENECVDNLRAVYPKARFEPPFRQITLYFKDRWLPVEPMNEVVLFMEDGMFVGFVTGVRANSRRGHYSAELKEAAFYVSQRCV